MKSDTLLRSEGMKTNEIVGILKDFFSQTEVIKVYLFGSRSRGEEKEDSDVDLLVYFPEDVNLLKIAKFKGTLEKKIHQKIDLLTPESISEKILPYIKKDMRLIYER
jgi:predicted nucleotidyltransferase